MERYRQFSSSSVLLISFEATAAHASYVMGCSIIASNNLDEGDDTNDRLEWYHAHRYINIHVVKCLLFRVGRVKGQFAVKHRI